MCALEFLNEILNKRKTGLVWWCIQRHRQEGCEFKVISVLHNEVLFQRKETQCLAVHPTENGGTIQIPTAFLDHNRPQHHAQSVPSSLSRTAQSVP